MRNLILIIMFMTLTFPATAQIHELAGGWYSSTGAYISVGATQPDHTFSILVYSSDQTKLLQQITARWDDPAENHFIYYLNGEEIGGIYYPGVQQVELANQPGTWLATWRR